MNLNDVDPKADNTADSYSQREHPPSPEEGDFVSEALEFDEDGDWEEEEEARPYNPSQGRRIAVVVAGIVLAGAVLAIIVMTMVQGSWWHPYGTGQALDDESWARVEAIRDEVSAHGAVPEVVAWLDAAMAPDIDSSTVRYYLIAAQEVLVESGDPKLTQAAGELRAIVQTMRLTSDEETITPRPLPTLEGFD